MLPEFSIIPGDLILETINAQPFKTFAWGRISKISSLALTPFKRGNNIVLWLIRGFNFSMVCFKS
ncbi:hypothetical protein D3C86_2259300 [compost metagenome]